MTNVFTPTSTQSHGNATRTILHVDMDAFYASIEQRDYPALRGQPLIVGGTGKRGVVAAASYEVRVFGVHSAMPVAEALRRCPNAIVVAPRMAHYREVSRQIFTVFHEFTPEVEGLSLDEAFLDVTHSIAALGSGEHMARLIRQRIRELTQLSASVGVAPNKLVAKIASDLCKPDGLLVVTPQEIHHVLDPLPITRLFGVGNKTAPRLADLGIRTFGELRHAKPDRLKPLFGQQTTQMLDRAAGIDDRPVVAERDEKQISSEMTFSTDIADRNKLHAELGALADRTATRLRGEQLEAGTITLKLRRHDFTTFTRQQRLQPPTCETRVIAHSAQALLDEWLDEHPHTALRLVGVGVTQLIATTQLALFSTPQSERGRELDATMDRIREKFGQSALQRGDGVSRPEGVDSTLRRK
jgi:DNA polymerase-4